LKRYNATRQTTDGDYVRRPGMDLTKALRARQRVTSVYNKRQGDFATLREWNDYLESVEEMIFNLTEGIDVAATEQKLNDYRRENATEIAYIANRLRAETSANAGANEVRGMEVDDPDSYAPGGVGAASVAVPAPVPIPTSAVRKGLEGTSITGWDDSTEEGRAARAQAAAQACGFDSRAVAKERCLREAFATIWLC